MADCPTAILAVSDASAWPILRWYAQNGIRVPDDLSVMGFDDDRPSQYMNPALTTTPQPLKDITRRALAILDKGWSGTPEIHKIGKSSICLKPILTEGKRIITKKNRSFSN